MFQSWKQLDKVEEGTIAIPSTMPVTGTNFTSGFGVRSDPFQGRAAMHAGVDLAGSDRHRDLRHRRRRRRPLAMGRAATAIWSRSTTASGIQTRYGHLSRSLVSPGQRVKRGDLIALMGSTGRSTGNHLHYEVRIDGKAVNPVPFMQSNDYLLALQRRTATRYGQVAMGGPVRRRQVQASSPFTGVS